MVSAFIQIGWSHHVLFLPWQVLSLTTGHVFLKNLVEIIKVQEEVVYSFKEFLFVCSKSISEPVPVPCALCCIYCKSTFMMQSAFRNTNQVNIMHKKDHIQSSRTSKLVDVKVSVKVLSRLNAERQLQTRWNRDGSFQFMIHSTHIAMSALCKRTPNKCQQMSL